MPQSLLIYVIAIIFFLVVIKRDWDNRGNDVIGLLTSALIILSYRRIYTLFHSPLTTIFPLYPTATSIDTIVSQTVIATLFMIASIKKFQQL